MHEYQAAKNPFYMSTFCLVGSLGAQSLCLWLHVPHLAEEKIGKGWECCYNHLNALAPLCPTFACQDGVNN